MPVLGACKAPPGGAPKHKAKGNPRQLLAIVSIQSKAAAGMADNALLLVERVLGTPASQQELNTAHVHLGSTCRAMAERAKKHSMLGSSLEEQIKVRVCTRNRGLAASACPPSTDGCTRAHHRPLLHALHRSRSGCSGLTPSCHRCRTTS